ncbi:MAG: helix-turn-helix domain-containing protein [Planctomycetota bacterium]
MRLDLQHVVVCRYEQETEYVVPCPTIALVLSGHRYTEMPGLRVEGDVTGFFLQPAGVPLRFGYTAARENYAFLVESGDIRMAENGGTAELRHAGEWAPVPLFVPVEAARLEGWRVEVEEIRSAFLMPTVENRLRAELGVLSLFRVFLGEGKTEQDNSPARRLKNLIDSDPEEKRTLRALCRECGYTVDHLRLLFQQAFGATPKQYRMRRRMAAAMEWVTSSTLSVKEIAARLGFRQVSHFSAAFRLAHDLSPREAIKRYRSGRIEVGVEKKGLRGDTKGEWKKSDCLP